MEVLLFPPIWLRLLRFYGQNSPSLRGKAWLAKWAYQKFPKISQEVTGIIGKDIKVELWPWLWADFCTYVIGGPEPHHLAYFKSQISQKSIVFDIGAYIGVYGMIASEIAVKGKVYIFEPDPRSAKRIKHTIKTNQISNIAYHQCAIGAKSGTFEFALQEYLPMSSLQIAVRSQTQTSGEPRIVMVGVQPLDEFCLEYGIRHIDIVKIDVEGAEYKVLEGGSQILERSRPKLIIELHRNLLPNYGHKMSDVLNYLISLKYELFQIKPGLTNPHLIPFDYHRNPQNNREIVIAHPS